MEALTALSVASSVIQFVDFGSKLVSKSKKLYKSKHGVLDSTIDSERIIHDLNMLLVSLKRKLPEKRILSSETPPERSENDEALDELCKRSVEIAEQILRRLERLRVPVKKSDKSGDKSHTDESLQSQTLSQTQSLGSRAPGGLKSLDLQPEQVTEGRRFSRWDSFRTALQEIWSKHELEELAATLREFRSEIEFRILLTFRQVQQSPGCSFHVVN